MLEIILVQGFFTPKLKLVNFLMNVNLKTIWVRVRTCQNGHATLLKY